MHYNYFVAMEEISMIIVFSFMAITLLFYLYCKLFLRLSFKESTLRAIKFILSLIKNIGYSRSVDDLIMIAYKTWLYHSYPAGRALNSDFATDKEIEQAALIIKALVASKLPPNLPDEIRKDYKEILELNSLELGYKLYNLIHQRDKNHG